MGGAGRDQGRLSRRVFRLSPSYRLIPFGRLEAEAEAALAALAAEPSSYGVLKPRSDTAGTIRVVDRESALLLLTLREAGRLPAFVLDGDDAPAWRQRIRSWIADSVIEIGDPGGFVAGPQGLARVSEAPAATGGHGPLARLSLEAIRHAAALGPLELETLAGRLYGYHRLPLTARWRRRLPDRDAVAAFLGLNRGGCFAPGWKLAEPTSSSDWWAWSRPKRGSRPPDAATFKLYASPAMDGLRETLAVLADRLGATRAMAFKVGGDAAGILRPDKMVAYFEDLESLRQAADVLHSHLRGIATHGVPFTAEVAGNGLLSWGIDPPTRERVLPWQVEESWRLWVARRLAAALRVAHGRPSAEMPAWRFALERLRLEGIDVDRWVPSPSLWRHA